jgi:anti-anti-sigma factor
MKHDANCRNANLEEYKAHRRTFGNGTDGMIFRFCGPFTARDMYSSLSPDAFRNIFEAVPGAPQPASHIFDLTEVPYMDSTGLGMIVTHFVRCRNKGIRLTITGLSQRVQELLRLTKMEDVLPIAKK